MRPIRTRFQGSTLPESPQQAKLPSFTCRHTWVGATARDERRETRGMLEWLQDAVRAVPEPETPARRYCMYRLLLTSPPPPPPSALVNVMSQAVCPTARQGRNAQAWPITPWLASGQGGPDALARRGTSGCNEWPIWLIETCKCVQCLCLCLCLVALELAANLAARLGLISDVIEPVPALD